MDEDCKVSEAATVVLRFVTFTCLMTFLTVVFSGIAFVLDGLTDSDVDLGAASSLIDEDAGDLISVLSIILKLSSSLPNATVGATNQNQT
jgi:hypothetical protein